MVDQAELISAAQAGDRSAFDELVRQTYVDTYTLALRLTSHEEDARDVVQDAYLRAWKGIGGFRGDARSARGCTGSPPTAPRTRWPGGAGTAPSSSRPASSRRTCGRRPSPRGCSSRPWISTG